MPKRSGAKAFMRWAAPCMVAVLLAGCNGGGGALSPSPAGGSLAGASHANSMSGLSSADYVREQIATGNFVPACPDIVLNQGRCLAIGLKDPSRAPRSEDVGHGSVSGYGPSQLQAAYNITSQAKSNAGGLVAVVEYSGDPNLASDLATYRSQFNLPPCTVESGCLTIVNQKGKTKPLPKVNDGWLAEQSLDVDMVSANCPNCKILVVEASSNLFAAEATAASFKPVAISNSWGGSEYKGEKKAATEYFTHSGIAITASAGDSGYGVSFPAALNTVTAVGGTSLNTSSGSRGYAETVWDGSGSGCSEYVTTPTWQESIESQLGGCTNRIDNDVAYDADPDTGVAVYETIKGDGEPPGWQVWGGTSVGAPAIAAIYALSGNTSDVPASIAYANPGDLYDVTSGSNGSCSPPYLCKGETGYDAPTGLGTPNGVGAF